MKYIETLRDLEKQLRDIDEKIRDLEYRRRNLIELRNRVLSYLRDEEDPWQRRRGFLYMFLFTIQTTYVIIFVIT